MHLGNHTCSPPGNDLARWQVRTVPNQPQTLTGAFLRFRGKRDNPPNGLDPAISLDGLWPAEPTPVCPRDGELGAIRIYHGAAVNGRFPCRYQPLGRGRATRNYDPSLSERFRTYSCCRAPCVSQRTRRRSGHGQSTALVRQQREDGAWFPLPAPRSRRCITHQREFKLGSNLCCAKWISHPSGQTVSFGLGTAPMQVANLHGFE